MAATVSPATVSLMCRGPMRNPSFVSLSQNFAASAMMALSALLGACSISYPYFVVFRCWIVASSVWFALVASYAVAVSDLSIVAKGAWLLAVPVILAALALPLLVASRHSSPPCPVSSALPAPAQRHAPRECSVPPRPGSVMHDR